VAALHAATHSRKGVFCDAGESEKERRREEEKERRREGEKERRKEGETARSGGKERRR